MWGQPVGRDSRRSIILKYDIILTESSSATQTDHKMENYSILEKDLPGANQMKEADDHLVQN